MQVFRSSGHTWIRHLAAGTCHVTPDGRLVEVSRGAGDEVDERILGFVLAGIVSAFVLHHRGLPSLHASGVVTPNGAVAFLGPKGQGKSTMAAGFMHRGAALLTDDILPLTELKDGIFGLPSMPIMKLWSRSAEHALHLEDSLPTLLPSIDKRLLHLDQRFRFAEHPGRLRAIYILDRYNPEIMRHDDITIRPAGQREGLMALIEQATLRQHLLPSEIASLMPLFVRLLAQAPVRVISFPNGFEHQQRVQECIISDVEESA